MKQQMVQTNGHEQIWFFLVNKGGKFILYKDGKMTGEFDPLEDPKHSKKN